MNEVIIDYGLWIESDYLDQTTAYLAPILACFQYATFIEQAFTPFEGSKFTPLQINILIDGAITPSKKVINVFDSQYKQTFYTPSDHSNPSIPIRNAMADNHEHITIAVVDLETGSRSIGGLARVPLPLEDGAVFSIDIKSSQDASEFHHQTKGLTRVDGAPVSRGVRAVRANSHKLLADGESDGSTGLFTLPCNKDPVFIYVYDDVGQLWEPGKTFTVGDLVHCKPLNGYRYRCTTAGQTGSTEPIWPAVGTLSSGSAVFSVEVMAAPSIEGPLYAEEVPDV